MNLKDAFFIESKSVSSVGKSENIESKVSEKQKAFIIFKQQDFLYFLDLRILNSSFTEFSSKIGLSDKNRNFLIKNQAYLKVLCDEIFGRENFVSCIVWNSINSVLKQSKFIRKEHEYILVYSNIKDNLNFNRLENAMEFQNIDNDLALMMKSRNL